MPSSPPADGPPPRLDFGTFSLDPRSGEVWRDGVPVHLAARPLRLLRYLAANRFRTVSKAELATELWPGVHVEESTIQQAVRAARSAVGDDGRRQEVIETLSGVGYRFVARPREEVADRKAEAPSLYVGQRALIATLGRSLEALSAGKVGLLLVSGDPGAGKSRAVEELSRLAWAQGFTVARGGANAPEGASAFWPWIEAFQDLSGARPVEALREGAPHLLGVHGGASKTSGEPDRFRARMAVLRFLEEAGRLGPVVVVLEDVHRAGPATLELLEFVLSRLDALPVLFVGTYRALELEADPERRAVLARLLDRRETIRVPIEPLSEVEAAYLVEQRAGLVIPAGDVSDVARHTGTNPFFALELADRLREDHASGERAPWGPRMERNAARALAERLDRLDAAVRSTLTAASVCGTTFDSDVVARALERDTIDLEIDVSVAERVVSPAPAGSRERAFAHALVRDALYDRLAEQPRECQALHLRVAEAMEALRPELALQVAHHLCAATPLVGARRVADVVEEVGRRAARGGDLETAAALYERALVTLEPTRARAPIAYLRILVAAGELGVRGDPEARSVARGRLDEAIGDLRAHDEPMLFARAVLARAYRTEIVGLADPRTIDLLGEAIERLGTRDPARAAMLRSRRAIELRYAEDGEPEALRAVDVAIEEARESGDDQALARVLEDASLVRWSVPDPEAWLRLNEEIVAAARRAGDTELVFQGVKGLATACLELGDRAGFEREVARCADIAEDYPAPFLEGVVACFGAARAFLDGDFAMAERQALLAASSGLDAIAPMAAGQLFYHRREQGRLAELEGAVRQFIEDSPGIAMWPIALARSLVDADRLDEAREVLEGIPPIHEIARDRNWLPTLIVLAESAVLLEDDSLCRQLFEALAPHARVNVVLGNGSLFLGQTAHYLGSLALALGREDEAADQLSRAETMHERMRSPTWRLRTRAEQVHLARRRGDVERAREIATQVAHDARAIGMVRCAERAEAAS